MSNTISCHIKQPIETFREPVSQNDDHDVENDNCMTENDSLESLVSLKQKIHMCTEIPCEYMSFSINL